MDWNGKQVVLVLMELDTICHFNQIPSSSISFLNENMFYPFGKITSLKLTKWNGKVGNKHD